MFKLQRGGQDNALTGPAFVLTIGHVIKFIESELWGMNVRAIQDDITMKGPPRIIFGTDGALEALQDGLPKSASRGLVVCLRPGRRESSSATAF